MQRYLGLPFEPFDTLKFWKFGNFEATNAVDIFVLSGSSGYETNYDPRPSFRRRGTSSMEQSSSVRHRLLVSSHLQKISQDLFVFTFILEHKTARY